MVTAKHYCDYFQVDPNYSPCMNEASFRENPRAWESFYPHESFVKILRTLLSALTEGTGRSLWISGAYGTGKSHAALQLQKLLSGENSSVDGWLKRHEALLGETVIQMLRKVRSEQKLLVVFDSGTGEINNPQDLYRQLQSRVAAAVQARGGVVPPSDDDWLLARMEEECEDGRFFPARDQIQERLRVLLPEISTLAQIREELKDPQKRMTLLGDITAVLATRDISRQPTVENVLAWLEKVRAQNGFDKILYIWDEFSEYLNNHSAQLTPFQTLAEAAQQGRFLIIPVTHISLEAFRGSGAESAKKLQGRFDALQLEMPTDTALLLAGSALQPIDGAGWENEREQLWHDVSPVVQSYMARFDQEYAAPEKAKHFSGVLPLHPMTAYLLRYLATRVGSNQRSMFDFLKQQDGESEFQTFLQKGGPAIQGQQFLTVDRLWHYFIERDDLGSATAVNEIRSKYARNAGSLSDNEKRVFRAVLLYNLMQRINAKDALLPLLEPSVENVKRCFSADTQISNVEETLSALEKKHCFAISSGRCELYGESLDSEAQAKRCNELRSRFSELALKYEIYGLEDKIRGIRVKAFRNGIHYEVKCTSPDKFNSAIASKDDYGSKGNLVLLLFLVGKDQQEQQRCVETARQQAKILRGFRILFVVFPEANFTTWDRENWEELVQAKARWDLSSDQTSKKICKESFEKRLSDWSERMCGLSQKLEVIPALEESSAETAEVVSEPQTFSTLENCADTHLRHAFPCFLDDLAGGNANALKLPGTAHKAWAKAGRELTPSGVTGAVVKFFQSKGISNTPAWFDKNPDHVLTQLRNACKKRLENTVGGPNGCSLRTFFLELRRAPYGMRGTPFSAFLLGFATSEWLDRGGQPLQWTDDNQSQPLDAATLDEIIEKAVKDDGDNKIQGEKRICRLSKEERRFLEDAPAIFGIERESAATTEAVLQKIAVRLEALSDRVPLWVLPEHIRKQGDPHAEDLCTVLENLCKAQRTSAKKEIATRVDCIKTIGTRLAAVAGLDECLKKYLEKDSFRDAFREMVLQRCPALPELAAAVGDREDRYCQALKEHFSQAASWLWAEENVDAELSEMTAKYQAIQCCQAIWSSPVFQNYDESIERLRNAMEKENKLSLETLAREFPGLGSLRDALRAGGAADGVLQVANALRQNADLIRRLFFDPSFQELKALLKKLFWKQLEGVSEAEIGEIYSALTCGALLSDEDFRANASREIEAYQKDSIARHLQRLWSDRTDGSADPAAWSKAHGMPAETLFRDSAVARRLLPTIERPQDCQTERLQEAIQDFKTAELLPEDMLEERFLQLVLPPRFRNSEAFSAKDLSKALSRSLSSSPEEWLRNPASLESAAESFVRSSYDGKMKARAVAKAKALSETAAKRELLALLERLPEAGVDFLNQ